MLDRLPNRSGIDMTRTLSEESKAEEPIKVYWQPG
jgi:hypothetical protein